jgi:hypothetical protein
MDATWGWILGGVLVVLSIWAFIMGRRFRRGKVRLGKHVSGELDAGPPGAAVHNATAKGEKNKITAVGEGSLVDRVKADGKGNVIGASSDRSK